MIGGGVVGLATACELTRCGARVTVIDAGSIGAQASSRNGGQVSPGIDGAWASLARRALDLWPEFVERLGDIEYASAGGLFVVMETDPITPEQIVGYRRERGFVAEALSPAECAARLPGLASRIQGGVFSPRHGQANPYLTTRALARVAVAAGAHLLAGARVTGVDVHDGRVRGVRTAQERISADWVVNAAGPWAASISALVGVAVPIRPRRIQIVMTERVRPLTRMVWGGNGLYSRQDAMGRLHFGADGPPWDPPAEHFTCDVTGPTLQRIAHRMVALVPTLAAVSVTHAWAGIIGPTPDLLPIIDGLDDPRGFVLATGFGGNGFGTAPAVGESVAELITTGQTTLDLSKFSLARFAA